MANIPNIQQDHEKAINLHFQMVENHMKNNSSCQFHKAILWMKKFWVM